jgi:hypothetical protein
MSEDVYSFSETRKQNLVCVFHKIEKLITYIFLGRKFVDFKLESTNLWPPFFCSRQNWCLAKNGLYVFYWSQLFSFSQMTNQMFTAGYGISNKLDHQTWERIDKWFFFRDPIELLLIIDDILVVRSVEIRLWGNLILEGVDYFLIKFLDKIS